MSSSQARVDPPRKTGAAGAAKAKRIPRGQVYNVEGHLGVPTKERLAKSAEGFDCVSMVEEGDGPPSAADKATVARASPKKATISVPRSVERAPFTTSFARQRITAEEIERAIRLGREPDFDRKKTAIDKALSESQWHALDWFVETYRRRFGRPATLRYDDTPRGAGNSCGGDDREYRWRLNDAILKLLLDDMPAAFAEFLDSMTWQVHPEIREGKPPSKIEVAEKFVMAMGRDRSEGCFIGAVKMLAIYLDDKRGRIIIEMNRRARARDDAIRNERKLKGAVHFGG